MTSAEIFELLARGGASALSLHLAITFLEIRNGSWAARLGCLFALGVAAYSLVSSNFLAAHLGWLNYVFNALAIPLAVFFWWFATALFDDRFRWHWWRFMPLVAVTVFSTWHFLSPPGSQMAVASLTIWQMVALFMMGHAALLGLKDLRDDLIQTRCNCRVVLAALVALTGMGVVAAEVNYAGGPMPDILFQIQAGILLALSLVFSVWVSRVRDTLFTAPPAPTNALVIADHKSGIAPEDQALAQRLEEAMADGIYREPNLTVGALADRLATPEHRLRKLINQGLGQRNFSSFLNQYRIADAQRSLADPQNARVQVLSIALDMGYGSIAPFNRAFKDLTGSTPTEFRKAALRQVQANA